MTPNYVTTYRGDPTATYGNVHALYSDLYPRGGSMPIVIYHHPHDSTANAMLDFPNSPGFYSLPAYLAANGYMVMVGDFADTSLAKPRAAWGNPVNHSAISDAKAIGVGYGGSSTKKIAVVGASMGACATFSYTARFPANVACAVGVIPALDIALYKTPGPDGPFLPGTTTPDPFPTVDAAYGGAYSNATYGSNHNPQVQASEGKFNTMPCQLWVDDNDSYASYNMVNAFYNQVKNLAPSAPITLNRITRNPTGNVGWGHTDAAILAISDASVLSFIKSYLT